MWDARGSRWVPAAEPLSFITYWPGCDHGWAVDAANQAGRTIRLTGHAEGAQAIRRWLDSPEELLANLRDARDAKWLVTFQGEMDAGIYEWDEYEARFRTLVDLVRSRTNPELRVAVIGIRWTWYGADHLRAAQWSYVASDPLAIYIPTMDLEGDLHLTRKGYHQLAGRVAAALR